jgi:hypothetical protein
VEALCRCSEAEEVWVSTSLQAAVRTAARAAARRDASLVMLNERASPQASFLESFPCINPFTAARLTALPCSLQQLLCCSPAEQEQLIHTLKDVPEGSLRLLFRLAAEAPPIQYGELSTVGVPQQLLSTCSPEIRIQAEVDPLFALSERWLWCTEKYQSYLGPGNKCYNVPEAMPRTHDEAGRLQMDEGPPSQSLAVHGGCGLHEEGRPPSAHSSGPVKLSSLTLCSSTTSGARPAGRPHASASIPILMLILCTCPY